MPSFEVFYKNFRYPVFYVVHDFPAVAFFEIMLFQSGNIGIEFRVGGLIDGDGFSAEIDVNRFIHLRLYKVAFDNFLLHYLLQI